jgi:PAS domain S-box-containing protein
MQPPGLDITTPDLSVSKRGIRYLSAPQRMETLSTEHFAELAVASADAGTFYIDIHTDSVVYSPSLGRIMTGIEQTGLTRQDLVNRVHPDDLALRDMAYEEAAKTGHLDYEVRFVWEDGSVHWARVVGRYLFNEHGMRVGFSGIALETTAEKTMRNEQQKLLDRIEQNEKRFRSMIEQAPVAMGVLKGPELVIETANNMLLELWGKDGSIIGKTILAGLPEITGQPFPHLLREVMETGKTYYGYEAQAALKRNGVMEQCYFNFVYAPYYEEGALTGVQVVAAEVTSQILAKKELQESEKRFRKLVEEAPVATSIYTGPNLVISLANEAMIKLWGKDASVVGKPLEQALPELDGQPFVQLLNDVRTTGTPYSAKEDRADLMVDGRLQSFYFNFTYQPLHDAHGKVYAILNMAVDVTESVTARKKIQQQEERYRKLATELDTRVQERTRDLQRANESLERSNSELAQYAYVASHDLQEPLRKIRVFSSMLEEQADLDERSGNLLARIISSSGRMSQLINDLLEFSRLLNAGKSMQRTDLNEVLTNVLQDFELSIQEKNAQIDAETLPVLSVQPLQMNQLFNNMVSNALKFSRPGVPLKLTIRSRALTAEEVAELPLPYATGKNYVQLTFADNGIGFEQQYAEQIFEIFKRLHSGPAYPGSGIGLALCRKIVDNHKGHLFATSKEGEGTVFHVVLPM